MIGSRGDLELLICLPLKCWDYGCVPPAPVYLGTLPVKPHPQPGLLLFSACFLWSLDPQFLQEASQDFCLTVMFLLKQNIARSFVVDTVNEFFMLKTNHYAIMQIKYNFVDVCGAA